MAVEQNESKRGPDVTDRSCHTEIVANETQLSERLKNVTRHNRREPTIGHNRVQLNARFKQRQVP